MGTWWTASLRHCSCHHEDTHLDVLWILVILISLCSLPLFFQSKSLCVAPASWSSHCSDQHAVLLPLFSFNRPILHTTRLDTHVSQSISRTHPLQSPM